MSSPRGRQHDAAVVIGRWKAHRVHDPPVESRVGAFCAAHPDTEQSWPIQEVALRDDERAAQGVRSSDHHVDAASGPTLASPKHDLRAAGLSPPAPPEPPCRAQDVPAPVIISRIPIDANAGSRIAASVCRSIDREQTTEAIPTPSGREGLGRAMAAAAGECEPYGGKPGNRREPATA